LQEQRRLQALQEYKQHIEIEKKISESMSPRLQEAQVGSLCVANLCVWVLSVSRQEREMRLLQRIRATEQQIKQLPRRDLRLTTIPPSFLKTSGSLLDQTESQASPARHGASPPLARPGPSGAMLLSLPATAAASQGAQGTAPLSARPAAVQAAPIVSLEITPAHSI
jgi:hypothetical protein